MSDEIRPPDPDDDRLLAERLAHAVATDPEFVSALAEASVDDALTDVEPYDALQARLDVRP